MVDYVHVISLPVFRVEGTILDQAEKVQEEADELQRAIEDEGIRFDVLLEALDVLQATVNLISMVKPSDEELAVVYKSLLIKHMKRGYIGIGDLELLMTVNRGSQQVARAIVEAVCKEAHQKKEVDGSER